MSDISRALIVDDDARFRTFLATVLRGIGFEVVEANDGLEALERLRTVSPSLLLTDVTMPRLDGLGLTRAVRATRPAMPVIVLSADSSNEDPALAAGADAFVWKLSTDMLRVVRRLGLALRQQDEAVTPTAKGA
jgi:CheY-like chemotaxis protein